MIIKRRNKKGMALVWAVVTAGLLMLISSVVATNVIKESQMAVRIDDSNRAYAAASSGIAWATKHIESVRESDPTGSASTNPNSPPTFKIGGNQVTVTITDYNPKVKIESQGVSNKATRKLIQWYQANPLSSVNPYTQPSFTSEDSFVLQYDFWMNSSGGTATFGVTNGPPGIPNSLIARYDPSGTIFLDVTEPYKVGAICTSQPTANTCTKTIGIKLSTASGGIGVNNIYTPYAVQLEIKYVKETFASLTVRKRDWTNSGYLEKCTRRVSVDLRETSLTFTNFVGGPTPKSDTGDGAVWTVGGGFIDNVVYKGLSPIAPTTFNITPSADTGCTISPNNSETVSPGGNSTQYSGSNQSGYTYLGLSIDGGTTQNIASYQFTNVQASHSIQAKCTPVVGCGDGWTEGNGPFLTNYCIYNSDLSSEYNWDTAGSQCQAITPTGTLPSVSQLHDMFTMTNPSPFTKLSRSSCTWLGCSSYYYYWTNEPVDSAHAKDAWWSSYNGWHTLTSSPMTDEDSVRCIKPK